jgi:hypothetical protein
MPGEKRMSRDENNRKLAKFAGFIEDRTSPRESFSPCTSKGCEDTEGVGPDRMTAICEAALKFIESEGK